MRDALQWMGYCALVSALLMVGAVVMEAAMRAAGRSTRWAWFGALVGSLVFPIVSYFTPVHVPYVASGIVIGAIEAAGPASGSSVAAPQAHHVGLMLWATAFVVVLAFIAYSYIRLLNARRTWTRSEIDGTPVWLSEDMGPAALGVTRTHIVLPRWVLALEKRALDLMMLHEREHLRAGDPRLMLASIVIAGTLPWNPFGWLMLRRLRLAIELDCDARVLSREPDATAYGAVLLEVGRRRAVGSFAMSTFAEPRSQLEVRIRRMAELPRRRGALRAAVLTIGALAFATAAYAMRAPMHGRIVMDPPADAGAVTTAESVAPNAALDTVPPVLRNGADVTREINRLYPPRLRDAGIEGTTTVAVYVSSSGKVTDTKLARSSGQALMDDAALRAAAGMVFTPAVHQGRRIGMLMMVRIPFRATVTGPEIIPAGNSVRFTPPAPQLTKPGVPIKGKTPPPPVVRTYAGYLMNDSVTYLKNADGVVDTVIHIKRPSLAVKQTDDPGQPKLINAAAVRAELDRVYPKALRDAGVTGGPRLWLFVDTTGMVAKAQVSTSSGNDLLDDAAMQVVHTMRYTPATRVVDNVVTKVPVWVSMQVVFGTTAIPPVLTPPGAVPTEKVVPNVKPPQVKRDSGEPFIVPMDVAPRLTNRQDVGFAIQRAYPPQLKSAGIGGKATVWFFIDAQGRVAKTKLKTASGYEALDEAALSVAETMKFTPAESKGHAIPVWIALDIVFQVK
jgi:TonB family protein